MCAVDLVAHFDVPAGCEINKLHTKFKHSIAPDRLSASVELPDLYVGETRDIVFSMTMTRLAAPTQHQVVGHVSFIDPFGVQGVRQTVSAASLTLERATTTRDSVVHMALNVQRNRVAAADALETAAALAAAGNVAAARETLLGALAQIAASPSAGENLCIALVNDLKDAAQRLSEARNSNKVAAVARMQHNANQHHQQRSTVASAGINAAAQLHYGANVYQKSAVDGYNHVPY